MDLEEQAFSVLLTGASLISWPLYFRKRREPSKLAEGIVNMHGFRHPFPPAAGHSARLRETLIIIGLLAGLASDAVAQRMSRGDALQSYHHGPTYNMLLLQTCSFIRYWKRFLVVD